MIFDDEETSDRRRLRWLLAAGGFLTILLVFVWWPGCRQYPTLTTEESLQLMKRLYAACNTKDPDRLAKVELEFKKVVGEGKMSLAEERAFAKIIDLARAGDWERAEKAAFRFAQDQVGQGSDKTRSQHSPERPLKSKSNRGESKK